MVDGLVGGPNVEKLHTTNRVVWRIWTVY